MLQKLDVNFILNMLQEQKVALFESLLSSTGRSGIDGVIKFLKETDFYRAPASSKYHSNYDSGLLDHSLIVYSLLCDLKEMVEKIDPAAVSNISDDKIIICSLLHDVCKTCFYKKAIKWKKNLDSTWMQYEGYDVEDTFPIGHGEKSVIMLQNIGLTLYPDEMLAIRYHMGFWGDSSNDVKMSQQNATKMYSIVPLLQMADFTASTIIEKEIKH